MALSLGLAADATADEIVTMLSRLDEQPRYAPRTVRTGPVKENVFCGKDVNVLDLPAPYLHEGDGGRYLGTWHVVITRMPDRPWVNWGMYRIMVHDEKTLGGLVVPTQHIGMHFNAWRELGKPMPFAIALGTDPVTPLVASMAVAEGVNEADIVGAINGEPIDVVQCETVDLKVPATAEIVIEGEVSIDETRSEGPFGEYTGYMTAGKKEQPLFHVTAITHRNNPILPVVCPGEPVDDHVCMSLSLAADALKVLKKANLPVSMTHIPPIAALHLLVVSVDKKAYRGKDPARDIGRAVWSAKIGTLLPKIVVVDQDIDPGDLNSVIWSFATKCHPSRGHLSFPEQEVFPLSPYLNSAEKASRRCASIVYDCTWPQDWDEKYVPKRGSLNNLWPEEIQTKVRRRWLEYGLEEILSF